MTVGTVKKSTAAMSLMWLSMKVLHVWERGLPSLIMYCSTVDFATFRPSSASSSRILGEPQSEFSREIRRISSRISALTDGRPGRLARDLQRQ